MGIVIIFASGLIGALFSLGYKFNGLRPSPTLVLLMLMSAVASLLSVAGMALFGEWEVPYAALYAGIPQGCASFAAVYLFVLVTRRSRLNVSWTIIQFYIVVPFFVSLLVFHDGFTLRGVVGVAAILLSILLFGRRSPAEAIAADTPTRWGVTMLVLSTLASGVANTMAKVYAAIDLAAPPFPMMLVSNGSFWLLATASIALRRVRRTTAAAALSGASVETAVTAQQITLTTMGIAGWMGIMQLSGAALLIVALTGLPGTVAYPMRIVMNIIGVVFFSRLLFGERLSRFEWAGTFIAIAGVALVASSA